MLTVHHLGISQSERIVWLCEELGIDYEFKRYQRRSDNALAPDDYKALHPAGTAPIITDGDVTLPESGAIIDYITAKYGDGGLVPSPSSPDFADYLFWYHYSNASFMAVLLAKMIIGEGSADRGALLDDRIERGFAMLEDQLGKSDYLAGNELTAADIMMGFELTTVRAFMPFDLENRPNIRAYIDRIQARPAYQRAMAKAEPEMAG